MSTTDAETVTFGDLRISFDDRVLRPRTWTTQQSEWAARLLPHLPEGPVLELCSGAGQIGLLSVRGSRRLLVCVDLNPVAASWTRTNAAAAGCAERVEMREGRILDQLSQAELFPLILADPPWVPRHETRRFPEDPLVAIDGGDDGLDVTRECLTAISAHLAPGGVALLQLGTPDQASAVEELLRDTHCTAGELRTYGERGVLLRIDREHD